MHDSANWSPLHGVHGFGVTSRDGERVRGVIALALLVLKRQKN